MQKMYIYCLRCGKRLKTSESRVLGYGPVCYEKHKKETHSKTLLRVRK